MDIVIGLIGAKGAGKTTAYEVIQAELDVQEITLAAKLKDVSAEVTGIDRNWFDSHRFKEVDLNDPVFLTAPLLEKIWQLYGVGTKAPGFFDKFVRPHVGQLLHTPRQIAQYVGTEVLRAYEPDIHCLEAAKAITKTIGVVTDMRFPNEYDFFRKNYPRFHTLYIQNNGAEIHAGKDTHASEAYLKDLARKADVTVINDSSIKAFQEKVRKYIKEHFNAEQISLQGLVG